MSGSICSQCQVLLAGLSADKQQATRVEAAMPMCACEGHSVGENSPGPVADDEALFRLVITPGDLDQHGNLLVRALKDIQEDGLSVFRGMASRDDVVALVTDRLSRKPNAEVKKVHSVVKILAKDARALTSDNVGRLFCVYDETVPRRDPSLERVPTHVTVLQRLVPKGENNRNTTNVAGQKQLYDELVKNPVDIASLHDGVLVELNERSEGGEFVRSQ